jgi:hypothetical protein
MDAISIVIYVLIGLIILTGAYVAVKIIFHRSNNNGLLYNHELYSGNKIVYTQGGKQSR